MSKHSFGLYFLDFTATPPHATAIVLHPSQYCQNIIIVKILKGFLLLNLQCSLQWTIDAVTCLVNTCLLQTVNIYILLLLSTVLSLRYR